MRTKRWTLPLLRQAVEQSVSIRQVLIKLKLKEAGGNYQQIKKYIKTYKINTTHFVGKKANKGKKFVREKMPLDSILTESSFFQSYKLKKRLFVEGIKKPKCELCGWAEVTKDGRIPVELDHINGNHLDNRLDNLRILCPNCHSLQDTHRGKNKKVAEVAEWYTRST